MRKTAFLLLPLIFSLSALAFDPPFIVEGENTSIISPAEIVSTIEAGSILVLGELHNNPDHHKNQLDLVQSLIDQGLHVNLGMEFLNYTDQYEIYKYGSELISKKDFLKNVEWKNKESFEFYSPMIDAVHKNAGTVLGLNIPRTITSLVAKNGANALSVLELSLLPSPLMYGSEDYFERFYNAVGGEHVPEDKIENYFWSQSIWDDVMSWKAIEFMDRSPYSVLVIIVGDFHVSYGGGLVEVLKRKGFDKVKSLSQTLKGESTDEELLVEIAPHEKYGPRADWIWVTK